jgi:hypothetical protein
MRLRRSGFAVLAALLLGAGMTATPANAASIYDPVTQSSLRNLVTAMQSWSMFDGDDKFTGVTASELSGWGWSVGAYTNVNIYVEGDGSSWRATAQDVRPGGTEFTYTSALPVNGAQPGSVTATAPQPPVQVGQPGLTIHDLGANVDLDALAYALVAAGVTVDEVCVIGNVAPAPSVSTTKPHTLGCLAAAQAAGATMRSVLAAMSKITPGVLAVVAVYTLGDGTAPATAPDWVDSPDPRPTGPMAPPASLPNGVWKYDRLVQRVATLNDLQPEWSRVATQQCLAVLSAALVSTNPYKDCQSKPIFMSGQADVPEASNHDLEAIAQNPGWVELNYRPRALNPSLRDWYIGDPRCAASVGTNGLLQCDEYPFFATEQGGGLATPAPSLKVIDGEQNQQQGVRYSSFLSSCGVQNGDPFYAIPIPPATTHVPTLQICNP